MRRHRAFLLVLAITAIVRFAILFLSQTHVTSDEAITGLMAKHISEGRYFPFYPYGISYNASQVWEAYLAVIPFWLFGVGVVALKIPIVLLSLICLALFYAMAVRLYPVRIATLASLIFAFWPGLLKWHFQPRGYAFYFLLIPALVILFLAVERQKPPRSRDVFLFGLGCGIGMWGMELLLIPIAALWLLLLLRRKFSIQSFAVGVTGFVIGYAPAIWWNLTHEYRNWYFLFFEKPETGGLMTRFGFSAWREIVFHEMPKFFSADTVLWYYPAAHWAGYVLYAVTVVAIAVAVWRAVRRPAIRSAFSSGFAESETNADVLMLILIAISFVPYIIAPLRVPGYFLGATFFMSILIARSIERSLTETGLFSRAIGAALLLATIVCGLDAVIGVAAHNEIETLTLSPDRRDREMIRIPGRDLEAVEKDLAQNQIKGVWTTLSFVYPLIFETGEKLIASESIFGIDRPVYPTSIPKAEPDEHRPAVFVLETNSPLRPEVEQTLIQKSGAPPKIREHGTLTVIEQHFAPALP
ncbi:MAG TPA: hypothetical protein VKS98_12155 [Chthoniobacterales bacterium]|nr:hypothetical protein [Chthoniobacterales bacterium]